jgi:predicted ester cyclase
VGEDIKAKARRTWEDVFPACDVAALDDLVAVHATHHARHTGELMGIPPTDRFVAYDYVHILRFRDGKAVEHWSVRDDMTLMRQLGALPDRPAAAAASA